MTWKSFMNDVKQIQIWHETILKWYEYTDSNLKDLYNDKEESYSLHMWDFVTQ